MFEHLDDHNPGRTGTGAQLAAVRTRARQITAQRRRSTLAVGSVTVAATASVSAVAMFATPGALGRASGQTGAGGARPGVQTKTGAAVAPGHAQGSTAKQGGAPSAAGKAGDPSSGPNGRGECAASSDSPAATTAPTGYVASYDTKSMPEGSPYHRADGGDGQVWVKVTCSGIAASDKTTTASTTYTPMTVAGRPGYVWHAGTDEAGVEWSAVDGTSVFIKATGAPGVRMSDTELAAFAASLPTT